MKSHTIGKENTTINTISGKALYSHTEQEDLRGNWDDHWETSKGEYVIHSGLEHHIYIIPRRA